MVVDSRTGRTGPVLVMAGIAVGADVLGRLLAPSLLKVWPLLVVSLSPSDPHLLLARVDPRALLVVVVVTVRIARALAVYGSVGRVTAQFRSARLRRLLVPSGESRWADRSAVAGVILLPGMVGAVVAARQRMKLSKYVLWLSLSTVAGVVLTLTAANFFAVPLQAAGSWIAHRSALVTVAVGAALALHLMRRLRGEDDAPSVQRRVVHAAWIACKPLVTRSTNSASRAGSPCRCKPRAVGSPTDRRSSRWRSVPHWHCTSCVVSAAKTARPQFSDVWSMPHGSRASRW